MSQVHALLAQLAPNGVEFARLGDLIRIKNGRDYKHLGAGDVPVYGTGGVMTYVDMAAHPGPSVLIPRKGSLNNLYYVDRPFWTVDTIFYSEVGERVEAKFVYYYLLTQRLEELNKAGGVPSLTQGELNQLRMPVPPLEVQREIVRMLDHFTELEAELKAELEARRQQYEHIRGRILEQARAAKPVSLGDIATIGTGSHDTKDAVPDARYVFYARGRETLSLDSFDFDEVAIITAGDGAGVGKVFHFANGKYALHQRAYRIVPGPEVNPRYLFHFFVADFERYLEQISVRGSVTSLRKPMFMNYPISLPSMDEQMRIVEVLDRFDALVNDLSIGLPAELAARRKQYEYYRDKLLTFEVLV